MLLYFLQSTAQRYNHYFILRLEIRIFAFYPYPYIDLAVASPPRRSHFFHIFRLRRNSSVLFCLSSLKKLVQFPLEGNECAIYKLVHVEIIDSKVTFFFSFRYIRSSNEVGAVFLQTRVYIHNQQCT